jgi:hypothetical protein
MANQIKKPDTQISFYPTVINKTDIEFSKKKMSLLNKGLKYSLNIKPKNLISNLALEAETAINYLPVADQEHFRW